MQETDAQKKEDDEMLKEYLKVWHICVMVPLIRWCIVARLAIQERCKGTYSQ